MDNSMIETKEKRALVLGGGGSRGAYQVGAMKALKELGYDFDIIVGTSVGSLNGAFFTSENSSIETAIELWSKVTTDMVLDYDKESIELLKTPRDAIVSIIEKTVKSGSIDQAPLRRLLEETLDVDAVYESKRDFGLVVVQFPMMKPIYLTKNDIPKEKFIDYLLASSAVFPAMKSIVIDDKQYIDGGFFDVVPISLAKQMGATEAIVIPLNSIGVRQPDPKDIKITKIVPRDDLGFLLMFDPDVSKVNMARGYLDTMKLLGGLVGDQYTFHPEDFNRYKRKFTSLVAKVCGKFKSNSIAENLVADTALTLIKRRIEKCASYKKGWIYAAAEITGKVFGISPLSPYSLSEFNNEILKSLDEVKDIELLKNPDITDALKTITDDKYLTKYLVGKLTHELKPKKAMTPINLADGFNLTPLVAAIYCIFARLIRDSEKKKEENE